MKSKTTGSAQVSMIAAAVFLSMAVTGYTVSTQSVNAEADARVAIPAIPSVSQSQEYFPAQYVLQATVAEDHIQAF